MYAFVECICAHSGIVRAGPFAHEFGDDYDFAVVYEIEGDKAIIKALVAPPVIKWWPSWMHWLWEPKAYTRAHHAAIFNAILRELHKEPHWDRSKKGKLRASKAIAPKSSNSEIRHGWFGGS